MAEPAASDEKRSWSPSRRTLRDIALVGLAVAVYFVVWQSGALQQIFEDGGLTRRIVALGPMGPVVIILLMTVAVVMSPIPSAPIALAAGAVFGHLWGTVYVAAGSLSGALIAFGISRFFGYERVKRYFDGRSASRVFAVSLKSQNVLMATVFATRLMPFLSFDVVSYAAGLTPLTVWRFGLATLAGILPASFLLAHFGNELASADIGFGSLAVLVLGGITVIPFIVRYAWQRRRLLAVRAEIPPDPME